MSFLSKRQSLRLSDECNDKVRELMRKYPDIYDSESHLIRCAIMELYNKRR